MAARATRRSAAKAYSREESRALVHVALRHALRTTRTSRAQAARWMGVAESTLTRWLQQRTPVLVEAVLCSRHLSRPFTACLALAVRRRNHGGVNAR